MKRMLAAALAAVMLTGTVVAEAGDRDRDRSSKHDERRWRADDHRHHRADRGRHVHRDVHVHRHVDVHRHRYHAGHYHRPPGYRAHAWRAGVRLPVAYYAPRYIVHDYHAYRLHRPPHGHHWVRVDRDVVLAAITTGAIIAVVHDLFH